MASTHLDHILITIILDPIPPQQQGFSAVLHEVPLAANSLDGDRVRTYNSIVGATADEASGFISMATLKAISTAFSQARPPTEIKVGNVDLVGAETYADAIALIAAVDPDFYGITIDSRLPADQLPVSAAVEPTKRQFFLQSSDADWKTTGLPAAYAAIVGRERTTVEFHDIDTEFQDVAHAANRLAFSPDTKSVPWATPVQAVLPLTAQPSDTEKGFLRANFANFGLEFGSPFFIFDGKNINGRPINEVLTADWFSARLQEAIASKVATKAQRGEKIVVDVTGQAEIKVLIDAQFGLGVTATHFVAGQTVSVAEAISAIDLTLAQLRFSGRAQLGTSATDFILDFIFSRQPVLVEE